jgi:hypothetical protein
MMSEFPKIEKWLCVACEFVLGYVEDKKTVHIKRKDLYVDVSGGHISMVCCRCGKRNELVDQEIQVVQHTENLNGREG